MKNKLKNLLTLAIMLTLVNCGATKKTETTTRSCKVEVQSIQGDEGQQEEAGINGVNGEDGKSVSVEERSVTLLDHESTEICGTIVSFTSHRLYLEDGSYLNSNQTRMVGSCIIGFTRSGINGIVTSIEFKGE